MKLCSDFYKDTLPDRSVTHVGKLYCHLCVDVQQLGIDDDLGMDITIGIIGCLCQDRLSLSDGETWAHKFYYA
jgi:hypothetical protein